MSDSKLPNDIDRVVGQRIRWRRRELKLTQEKLGDMLELTFQQVQKYEKGINRISAGRLFEMANVLGVPVAYFYEGVEEHIGQANQLADMDEGAVAPVMDTDTLDLIAAFQKITDSSLRKSILNTVKATASALSLEAGTRRSPC